MRIICPACGVNMEVPDDEPGGVVECAGCGKRFRYGGELEQTGDDEQSIADSLNPYVSKRPVRPRRDYGTLIAAGLVGALSTGMVMVLVMVARRENTPVPSAPATVEAVPWDQAHRTDLLQLKDRAESLAMQGKWQESYDAYQQILFLVGDHDVKDPVALAVIDAVRPGEDRAMSAMLASRVTAPPPAAAEGEKPPTTKEVITAATEPGPASRPVAGAATTQGAVISQSATTQATPPPVTVLTPAELAADTAPPLPGPPPPPPSLHAYTLADQVTDQQIGESINKGVLFLGGQFRNGVVLGGRPAVSSRTEKPAKAAKAPVLPSDNTRLPSDLDNASDLGNLPAPNTPLPPRTNFVAPHTSVFSQAGIDALCVYALLNAGRAMDVPGLGEKDPFTIQILEQLKRFQMDYTYHRSLRAAALSVFNRTEDNAALEDDMRWLQSASTGGAYTYTMPPPNEGSDQWDNSNSQYGLLGVWSGAQVGQFVPQTYWSAVASHWTNCASPDGTWGYGLGGGSTLTMTCAGVVSMLVARDYLDAPGAPGVGGFGASSPLIEAGLSWLDQGDNCMVGLQDSNWGAGYGLYGLERVGLASGFKYFGRHDWYSELAKTLVQEQHFNGSWGGGSEQTLIDTSYALLFLARGRHPILFNKLRYDGDWNNRPHDAAHLARFAAHQLERPLNWQVVNLRRNWFDWMDCPVLYISGDKRLNLGPQDLKALRDFANGGGTIFTHADGGGAEFNKWVAELVRQIFPKYELMQVPRESPMYSTVYPIKNPPPLLSVSNGSRMLLIHSPTDLAGGWQLNWTEERKQSFQMGVNLFIYAAGKGNLKNRLASSYIPEDPNRADSVREIARLQYAGEWDPEPYAWTRFARYFQWETHQAIEPVVVPLKALVPGAQPMAVLTGTVRQDFTDAEVAAAKAYVQAGGVLLIDACGGQNDFIKSVETTLLPKAFPGTVPTPIAPNHPLLIASRSHADDLTHALLRGYAIETGGKNLPIETIPFGKGWVVFSRLDLTTGLLGTQSWGIRGFDPAYSQALMKNAILWAEARSPLPAAPAD